MKLASILNEHLIFCSVSGRNRSEIYGNLLRMAATQIQLPDSPEKLVAGIIEREDAVGMEYDGLALPHIRLEHLTDLAIIIGMPEQPVQLRESDGAPTSIIILSLIGDETGDTYLKALSAFVRYLGNADTRQRMLSAGSPAEVLAMIRKDNVCLKKTITAEDLMNPPAETVSPDDNLTVALDIFNRGKRMILPVTDATGKLVGELDATEVIRHFIPEYIFMMESTRFLVSFEPFERIFREEQHYTVRELMQPPRLCIRPDVPLIRFTISLVNRTAGLIFVTDEHGMLIGELSIKNIIHKVLRG